MIPELLAPVGGPRQLKAAVRFGADAVYMGAKNYGLRAFASNFDEDGMAEAIAYCHAHNVRCYITLNIFPFDDDLPGMAAAAKQLRLMGADAAIVSDLGALETIREAVPDLPLHLSTQANTMNHRSALIAQRLGASRIILAREMSLARIAEMKKLLPEDLTLETFVHGAMCMSYSGRCVLSDYMAGRGANKGACAQPCRWKYYVMEEKRPGEYFPVESDGSGTYIFSSGDMRMLEHLPDMIGAGIGSLKIEGRMKNEYYVGSVTRVYRKALDLYKADPANLASGSEKLAALSVSLDRVSHRRSDTGFFYGSPKPSGGADGFYQTSEFAAYVLSYDAADGSALVEVRNRMLPGDELGVLTPEDEFSFRLERLEDPETGNKLESAKIGKAIVRINMPQAVAEGDLVYGVVRNHLR